MRSRPTPPESLQLTTLQRGVLVVAGSVLLVLLTTAAFLEPSPTGVGTHRKLGLPPCSFRVAVGVRCPACGMTTSWSHFVRGQFGRAMAANLGGSVLALLAVFCGPWSLVSGIRGRCWLFTPGDRLLLAGALSFVGVTLVDWIRRLLESPGS